jgi:hypothetical protein
VVDISSLRALTQKQPAYIRLFIAALRFCLHPQYSKELVQYLGTIARSASAVQGEHAIIEMLVNNQGLEKTILVDEEPYLGSLSDLQAESGVSDEADIQTKYQTTEEGRAILEAYDPLQRCHELFKTEASHRDGFLFVLDFCNQKKRCAASDLEEGMKGTVYLKQDERTKLPTVYPSYFTTELERVGLLDWDREWCITESGKEALRLYA